MDRPEKPRELNLSRPIPYPFSFSDTEESDTGSPKEDESRIPGNQSFFENEASVLSGFLKKKGERRKNWKQRFFVLRLTKLAYYADEKEYEILNMIPLDQIHSVSAIELKKRLNVFGIVTKSRTFYLQAPSHEEMTNWIEQIKSAVIHSFPEARLSVIISPKLSQLEPPSTLSRTVPIQPVAIPSVPIPIPGARLSVTDLPLSNSPAGFVQNDQSLLARSKTEAAFKQLTKPSPLAQSWSKDRSVSEPSEEDDQAVPFSNSVPTASPTLLPQPGNDIVLIQGFIYKQKRILGGGKSWRKYWFVVRNGKLISYKDEVEYEVKQLVLLAEVVDVLEIDNINSKKYCFKLVFGKKSWVLCAESQDERERWIRCLEEIVVKSKS